MTNTENIDPTPAQQRTLDIIARDYDGYCLIVSGQPKLNSSVLRNLLRRGLLARVSDTSISAHLTDMGWSHVTPDAGKAV